MRSPRFESGSFAKRNRIFASEGRTTLTGLRQKNGILIVDNHPVFRQGLVQLINAQSDLVICGEADTQGSALMALVSGKPQLVIVDLGLKNSSSGLELIKDLKIQHPGMPVLVLTMHEETLYAERCLRAGARGYIMKDQPGEEILLAVRRLLCGKLYVSDEIATKMLVPLVTGFDAGSSPIDRLSDRELEVFQLLGKAYETRAIAEKLRVSVKTVESYREHIKTKLNLENATQLIHQAVIWSQKMGIA